MWGWGRPRRNLPEVDYRDYDSSEDDFNSPLVSPSRPPQTRAGSPAELAVPTLGDNVDEELEQVRQTLQNVGHSHTFRGTHPAGARVRGVAEVVGGGEEVVEGLVVQGPDSGKVADENPIPAVMVAFEDENGEDEAKALQEGCRNVANYQWNQEDIKFWFGQIEIKMASVGVKKN